MNSQQYQMKHATNKISELVNLRNASLGLKNSQIALELLQITAKLKKKQTPILFNLIV